MQEEQGQERSGTETENSELKDVLRLREMEIRETEVRRDTMKEKYCTHTCIPKCHDSLFPSQKHHTDTKVRRMLLLVIYLALH